MIDINQGWKNHDLKKLKNRFFSFKLDFFGFFRKFVFSCQGFTKFLKLVCLLNHTNNMAAMFLLFPVILLLSKKVSKQQLIKVSLPWRYMMLYSIT